MSNIGKWSAQASLDASGFTSGIQKMTSGVQAFVKGPNGLGLLTNLPAALGLSSLSSVASRLSDTLERELDLGFLADQLGAPIGFLQQLRVIASENSVSTDQFSAAMERMNQTLGQARLGNSEAIETFDRLGISLDALSSQDFQTNFMQIARALANIQDRSVRARTAMQLFGRGGAGSMLRFVTDLESSLPGVQARGIGADAERALERFKEMDDAIDRMTTRWDETWKHWLSVIAPAVTMALEGFSPDATATPGSTQSMAAAFWTTFFDAIVAGGTPGFVASMFAGAKPPVKPPSSGGNVAIPGAGFAAGPGMGGLSLGMATFGAVMQRATEASQRFLNAQLAAARQSEMLMERLRGFVEQARGTVENFRIAIRQITTSGLNTTQVAVLLGQRAIELMETIPSGQLSDAMQRGSAEAITAANEVLARRLDGGPMGRMRAALEFANEQRREQIEIGRQVLDALKAKNDPELADILGGGV